MSEQFKEQGGAATMDPGPVRRWLTSKMMTAMSSPARQQGRRHRAERQRAKRRDPHRVEYFHQVDDPYSHLAAQLLERLQQRYEIEIRCHLVSESGGANLPEPELLRALALRDAKLIAPHYRLVAPELDQLPSESRVVQASSILANLESHAFVTQASRVSDAVWDADQAALNALQQSLGAADAAQTSARLSAGNQRRQQLKHYSGAMFYYAGEWYWGVDRLYHLEQRLIELELDNSVGEPLLAPRPEIAAVQGNSQVTLEVFPSLRSPYTAVVFDQTVAFAEQAGIAFKVRPVLPMVMRGVPATLEKGQYILFDAGREARAAGVPFGPCYDPIGEPTRRAYSLYAWADQQGKAVEFFSAFLRCAWTEAINTNNDKGLKHVVEQAGLDWVAAQPHLGNEDWQTLMESNRELMYELGLWGVPSYRLLDETGQTLLAAWGQDRLWLVAKTLQQHLDQRTVSA